MRQQKWNQGPSVTPAMGVATALRVAIPAGLAVVLAFIVIVTVTNGRLRLDDWSGAVAMLSGWLALCCIASCSAAWIVTSLANRRGIGRFPRILLLALLTKLLAVLLMPVVIAIWSAPSALSGGNMPCLSFGQGCQAGLHGWAAVQGLVAATLSWYPMGIFMILPGNVDMVLLIPAAVWDRMMGSQLARLDCQPSM